MKKTTAGIIIGLILLAGPWAVNAQAISGQVTIFNVDAANPATKLNGAQIRVVNQETNAEYTDIIQYNGTIMFELPLGKYYVEQVKAPDPSYELNTTQYEFSLQLPTGANADAVKVVNTSVTIMNSKTAASAQTDAPAQDDSDPEATPREEIPEDEISVPAIKETIPPTSFPTEVVLSSSDRNPKTADFSWLTVSAAGLSVAVVCVILWFIRRIRQL